MWSFEETTSLFLFALLFDYYKINYQDLNPILHFKLINTSFACYHNLMSTMITIIQKKQIISSFRDKLFTN